MTHQLAQANIVKGSLCSPITKGIVAFLAKHGPARRLEIDLALMRVPGYAALKDPQRPARTLHALREQGHIHRVLRNDEMLWAHGPHPNTVSAAAEAAEAAAAAAVAPGPYVGAVVPSACFDLMHAPTYVPPAGPALRPGALDYKRCASHGVRC
jgi:hypothetical protein